MTGGGLLRRVAAVLSVHEVPFMLTGSVAAAYHGAPRATIDIDLVIAASASQLRPVVDELSRTGLYVSIDAALQTLHDGGMFNVIDASSGWKVDLIHRKERAFSREEFARRIPTVIDGAAIAVASLEDVVLSKLEWARTGASGRQLEDVATLLRVRSEDLDRRYLAKWVTELGVEREWLVVEAASRTDE